MVPFFWKLPLSVRSLMAKYWTPLIRKHNYYLRELDTMHLLVKKEMRELFPEANILSEKFLGLVKSLIAWY